MTTEYPSLEAVSAAIGVRIGTIKDWAYKRLKLRSPFSYEDARRIAAIGVHVTSKAKGGAKPAALENQKKCLEFLGEFDNGND